MRDKLYQIYDEEHNSSICKLFKIFHANKDGLINFIKLITGISNLKLGPVQKKLKH
jgi:Ca2+-binding EF-hand superfamily protein